MGQVDHIRLQKGFHFATTMPKVRELTNADRHVLIALREEGVSVQNIARRLQCCRQTVYRVWARYEQTGDHEKLNRSGRPKKTTPRDDRRLLRTVRLLRFKPVKILAGRWCHDLGRNISNRTVRRRIRDARIFSRISRRKPLISLINRQIRIRWATRVRGWTVQDNWRHIVFSDECRFNLTFDDGRIRVWREVNTAYEPRNLSFTTRNAVSIMVWGCIGYYGIGNLVLVDGNMDHAQYRDILDGNLFSSVENIFGYREHPFIFQDDNATPHRARALQDWLFQQGVTRMNWPSQSPDANPIENLWDDIGKQVLKDRPFTRDALIQSVFIAWGNLTAQRVPNLYETLPRRMAAIIRSRGYPTKY